MPKNLLEQIKEYCTGMDCSDCAFSHEAETGIALCGLEDCPIEWDSGFIERALLRAGLVKPETKTVCILKRTNEEFSDLGLIESELKPGDVIDIKEIVL